MHTLFFDFDGTLRVPETNEVSKETIQNLRTLRKEGNLIFINTGRCFSSLEGQAKDLPLDGVICGCGTYIRYRGQILYEVQATSIQKERVLKALRTCRLDAFLEGHGGLFVDQTYSDQLNQVISFFKRMNVNMLSTEDPSFEFSKMSLYYTDQKQKDEFESLLKEDFDFINFPNLKAEAVLKGHSKASGMRMLLKELSLPCSTSIAFGDSDNDMEMLKEASCSVLIGKHAPHLQELADLKAPSAKEEGISWALRKLNLIEE